jgi:hypothetical protein
MSYGSLWLRTAQRALCIVLFHEPPRTTRSALSLSLRQPAAG